VDSYRINIGNGRTIVNVYGGLTVAETIMHDIIESVTKGEIYVEEKLEQWKKVPT
jgi:hypothetical protein